MRANSAAQRMLIGGVEVSALVDAVGVLARYDEVYPDVPAQEWDPYRERFADLFAGDSWRIPCTSYLLRTRETTVLVDTGVGPPGLWDWDADHEGGLPGLLDPEAVDLVFLTHLHIDHVGWNTDADGNVFFPNARYVAHRDAVAFARPQDRPHIHRCVRPIRFDELDAEHELASSVAAFELRGHYPGHMGVRIGEDAVLIADAAVHPALLEHPDWLYVSDNDPAQCAQTRLELLPQLEGKLVVCGHYPGEGIGRVVDGRWEPIA